MKEEKAMNNLQEFTNGDIKLPVRTKENGDIEFDAEKAAIGLGISETAKSGNDVVKWTRVNKYLSVDTSVDAIKRGDFITEPQFYKLAIKANNPTAEKAAIGLGIFENKNNKKYVIWKRISKYLSTQVSKGDFISEPQFYKLAIKANNPTAEKAAIGLGLIQSKNKKIYVRWETVSKYLSQKVGKNDFITEQQVARVLNL